MQTKTLTPGALALIQEYLHFNLGKAHCSVPYFNNKTKLARAALRVHAGKGTPSEIRDEAYELLVASRIDPEALDDASLKKILRDKNLGIDCSGFVYHVLDEEFKGSGRTPLNKRISFVYCRGLFAKAVCSLRPAENCNVATFAHDDNSSLISVADVLPGDIITIMGGGDDEADRDHILLIHAVDYRDGTPISIRYSHAIAYPQDGLYGTGVRQGAIEISDPQRSITVATWTENDRSGDQNPLYIRASKGKTELRRIS